MYQWLLVLRCVLKYLDDWRAEANANEGMSQQENNRLCLSKQTDNDWHITSKILILPILVKKIFRPKYSFFLESMYLSIQVYIYFFLR